eukprot:m.26330 g.26330  ORF g.26330 m.26330 type:complete len:238 (-) comp11689_c0_seq1:18-731(-)
MVNLSNGIMRSMLFAALIMVNVHELHGIQDGCWTSCDGDSRLDIKLCGCINIQTNFDLRIDGVSFLEGERSYRIDCSGVNSTHNATIMSYESSTCSGSVLETFSNDIFHPTNVCHEGAFVTCDHIGGVNQLGKAVETGCAEFFPDAECKDSLGVKVCGCQDSIFGGSVQVSCLDDDHRINTYDSNDCSGIPTVSEVDLNTCIDPTSVYYTCDSSHQAMSQWSVMLAVLFVVYKTYYN